MTVRVRQAQAQQAQMVEDRRHLHARPEVGLDLAETHGWVTSQLMAMGLTPESHESAGVSVRFEGVGDLADSQPTVVLRVDMDALPVEEKTGLPFSSSRPDAMHACGHDLHTAVGLATARVLARKPPERHAVVVFQPGEESDRGAVPTLDAHDNLRIISPSNAFAVHVHAQAPTGQILLRDGTFMAHGDWFTASFHGPGGHASAPENTSNPIAAGSYFVDEMSRIIGLMQQREHAVATVTEFHAGSTVNVIPARSALRGTIRTLSQRARTELITRMQDAVDQSATAARVSGTWELHPGYPAVINDPGYVAVVRDCLAQTDLAGQVAAMADPSMVIEDFSYFLEKWPGMMVYVGAHVPGCTSFNHADDVLFDEVAMTTSLCLYLLAADGWQISPSLQGR